MKAVEGSLCIIIMPAGEKCTFVLQLGLQLLVPVGELPVLQEKFVVQPSPGSGALLERGNISVIDKDSRRVIFTRPSTNYPTRISGTGDDLLTYCEDSCRVIFTRPSINFST